MLKLKKFKGFQWDKGNKDKNLKKHKVTNFEAEQVFLNNPLLVEIDEKHSTEKEKRYFVLGCTNSKRYLFAVFTYRNDLIRVISARDMSKYERETYEKEVERNS